MFVQTRIAVNRAGVHSTFVRESARADVLAAIQQCVPGVTAFTLRAQGAVAPTDGRNSKRLTQAEVHQQRLEQLSASDPVLAPASEQERCGTVNNVVFPTGIDRRVDLGTPDRFDIYYGMADNRIGVARLTVPELLTPRSIADAPLESASDPLVQT